MEKTKSIFIWAGISTVIGIALSLILWNVLWLFVCLTIYGFSLSGYLLNYIVRLDDEFELFYDSLLSDIDKVINSLSKFFSRDEYLEYNDVNMQFMSYLSSFKQSMINSLNSAKSKVLKKEIEENILNK